MSGAAETRRGETALDRVARWLPGNGRDRVPSRDAARLREDLGMLEARLERVNTMIPRGNVQLSPHVRGLAKMVGSMEMLITSEERGFGGV